MPLPTLQSTNQGFPAQFASKVENVRSSNQGDNVYVTAASGDCLIAIAFGLKSYDPFDLLHGASPSFGFLQGLNDFNANPTISDNSLVTPESPFDVRLGTAANYALLAAAGITNTGGTVITGGNVGSFPTTSITPGGWVLTPPATIDNTDAAAAQGAALSAYNFFSSQTFVSLGASTVNLSTNTGGGGGAGVYHAGNYSAGSSMDMPTSITLDAQGNPNATWIFKAGSTITLESGASVILANGAQPQNVIWLVGSSFTSVATSNMVGTILANTSITLGGGTLKGRALAGVVTTSGAITISARNDVTVTPLGGSVNNWVLAAHINLVDSDYTVSSTPPTAPNPFPSSQWNLDGYYPSIYIWVAQNANAGTYAVNLNSVYQNGIVEPLDLAAGKPIFDGGVNFQVIKFSGILTSGAADGSSFGTSTAAASAAPAFTTTQGSELLLSVGLMKSGNVFGAGSVIQAAVPTADAVSRISNGKLVGSEAHYMVEYAIPAAASATTQLSFSNPLGYEMVVGTIALKHS
jgi:hypothetical protein